MTQEKQSIKKEEKKEKIAAKPLPVDKEKAREIEAKMEQEKKVEEVEKNVPEVKSEKDEESKVKEKKETKKIEIPKKEEAIVRGTSLPISKKHAMYLGKFIKNKKIDDAITELEEVIKLKRAVPFKGEIPHRKGIGRGRYPVKASSYFINLLKALKGNAITNQMELEDTRIYFISPSWAPRPLRRGGRKAKRTHVTIKAKEIKISTQNKEKKK